jgi:hypothetical protein
VCQISALSERSATWKLGLGSRKLDLESTLFVDASGLVCLFRSVFQAFDRGTWQMQINIWINFKNQSCPLAKLGFNLNRGVILEHRRILEPTVDLLWGSESCKQLSHGHTTATISLLHLSLRVGLFTTVSIRRAHSIRDHCRATACRGCFEINSAYRFCASAIHNDGVMLMLRYVAGSYSRFII